MADCGIVSPSRARDRDMAKALKIAPTEESTLYVPRIRALVEAGRVGEARELVKEALLNNPTEPELQGWREALSRARILGTEPAVEFDQNTVSPEIKPALAVVAHNQDEPFVQRIQALLELADLRGARKLLQEARERGSLEPELEKLEKLLAPPTYELIPADNRDRSDEIQWLKEHANEYRGQWVAVLENQLLAHSPVLRDLMRRLDEVAPGVPALLHFIEV